MLEYLIVLLLVLLIGFVIVYAIIKGVHLKISVNFNMNQQFSAEDRKLLEDLYNKQGDLQTGKEDFTASLDEVVRAFNELMVDVDKEENSNG